MGFLTPVLIRNDSIFMIKDDPYFAEELSRGAHEDKEIYVRSYRKTWVDVVLAKLGLYRKPKLNSWGAPLPVLKSLSRNTILILGCW